MTSSVLQVTNYLNSTRVGVADFVNRVCIKEMLGHTDNFCNRQKTMLVAAYLDCVVNYFTPFIEAGVDDHSYDTNNFFTTDEIKDIMQHINNICGTFYTLDL